MLFWYVMLQTVSSTIFRVRDFGAVGDGRHNDTGPIAAALDAAAARPGSLVLLEAPGVYLSGSLYMRSHTTFRVEAGATLLGSPIYSDYPFAPHPGVVHPDRTLPSSSPPRLLQRESLIAGARCQAMNGSVCTRSILLPKLTTTQPPKFMIICHIGRLICHF